MRSEFLPRVCALLALMTGPVLGLHAASITFFLDSNGQITNSTTGVGNFIEYTHVTSFTLTATAWHAAG